MEKKKIRVCECFAGRDFIYGGIEEFIINLLKNSNSSDIEYEVFIPGQLKNEKLISVSCKKEINVITENVKFHSILSRKLKLLNVYKNFFKNHQYDVVHIHGAGCLTMAIVAKIAKKFNTKKVIIHSHLANGSLKDRIDRLMSKHLFFSYVDRYLACSDVAAQSMFPNKIIKEKKYLVINNGINVEKFVFNSQIRNEYREKFGLKNELVLCNVGRFAEQKNHKFMVEIAKVLTEKKVNYKFILVGDGNLKDGIVKRIKELKLSDRFIFLEKRNDIPQIMMASDVFIFPSKFEGLGIVAVEAQASGLPVIASTQVPVETNLTDIINYVDLDKQDAWVDLILSYAQKKIDRTKYAEVIRAAGYDAKTSANVLEEIYFGWYNE